MKTLKSVGLIRVTTLFFIALLGVNLSNAQIEVTATRLTHLLPVENQAEFNHQFTIHEGEKVQILNFSRSGYYKVHYGGDQPLYIYYPYFSEVPGIEAIQAGFLKGQFTESNQEKNIIEKTTTNSPTSTPSRVIHTGPRGGRYYINSKGNKVYVKD